MKPIIKIDKSVARDIKILASDLDGTLLVGLEFIDPVLDALKKWISSGRKVIFLTGRPATWVLDELKGRLPVDVMLAENGGVIYQNGKELIQTLCTDPREKLEEIFEIIKQEIPEVQRTKCDHLRRTDLTINIREYSDKDLLTSNQIERIHQLAAENDFQSTESHIHIHIFTEKRTNKGEIASRLFLETLDIPDYKRQVIVMGDSLNDEAMFNPDYFPISCGVANIKNYLPRMTYKPAYVASKEQGWGVIEVIEVLMGA